MNVALPALVVFALVLPGFIFRNRFKRNEKTALDYAPFGGVVAEAVIWAVVLHFIWLLLAWLLRDQVLHAETLMGLLSSNSEDQSRAIKFIHLRADWLAQYFLSLLFASLLVPTLLRKFITKYRLDRYGAMPAPFARFHDAPWYYLLTGADFKNSELPDYINVSAVVNIAGTPYLFQGMLDDFFFSSDGQLDRLILENVSRRLLSKDKAVLAEPMPSSVSLEAEETAAQQDAYAPVIDDRFYPVDGDYFVLRMSEAITLNVQYVKLLDVATAPTRDIDKRSTHPAHLENISWDHAGKISSPDWRIRIASVNN